MQAAIDAAHEAIRLSRSAQNFSKWIGPIFVTATPSKFILQSANLDNPERMLGYLTAFYSASDRSVKAIDRDLIEAIAQRLELLGWEIQREGGKAYSSSKSK
jgi:hypothetical protein